MKNECCSSRRDLLSVELSISPFPHRVRCSCNIFGVVALIQVCFPVQKVDIYLLPQKHKYSTIWKSESRFEFVRQLKISRKSRETARVLCCLHIDYFHFTRKISKFFSEKISWKCNGSALFLSIDYFHFTIIMRKKKKKKIPVRFHDLFLWLVMYNRMDPFLDGSFDLVTSALQNKRKEASVEEVLGLHPLFLDAPQEKNQRKADLAYFLPCFPVKSENDGTTMFEFWLKKKRPRKLITRSISDYVISSIACFAFSSGEMVSWRLCLPYTQMYLIVYLRYSYCSLLYYIPF